MLGLAKIMSKMGISVVDSYRDAHLFDSLGLHSSVIDSCFYGTPAPLGGIGFSELERHLRETWQLTQGEDPACGAAGLRLGALSQVRLPPSRMPGNRRRSRRCRPLWAARATRQYRPIVRRHSRSTTRVCSHAMRSCCAICLRFGLPGRSCRSIRSSRRTRCSNVDFVASAISLEIRSVAAAHANAHDLRWICWRRRSNAPFCCFRDDR